MKQKVFTAILVLIFLFVCYTEIHVSYALFFPNEYAFSIPIFLLALLTLVISGIIYFINKSRFWKFPAFILLFMATGFGLGKLVSNWQNKHTVENMDNVIKAIEHYEKDKEKYPDSLVQLVPKWINKIPDSYCGIEKLNFYYIRINNSDYNECVRLQIYDRRHIAYRIYDKCYYEGKPRITYWDSFNH